MKRTVFSVIAIGIFMTLGVGAWKILYAEEKSPINSFQACIEAKHRVIETYPRQCRLSDGTTFIERRPGENKKPANGTVKVEYTTTH